ncbi:hypothetical protein J6S88_03775 [bacterium]|nr:hypothetical protein [bacterium]
MNERIYEHNLEDNLMEEFGLLKSIKSTQDIMIKAAEDTSNDELKIFIDSLILLNDKVNLILFKHDQIIKEFQEKYCIAGNNTD